MIVRRVDELKRLIALIPESGLDLINIFRLVEVGDVLYSRTSREMKKERASGKIDSERVQVVLGIEVESKVADPLMRRIRFTGRIVHESRKLDLLGKHHTITLYPGVEVKVQSKKDFERLKSFAAGYGRKVKRPVKVICVSVDDYEIAVAEFSNSGLEVIYAKSLPSVDKSSSWSEPAHGEVFGEAVKALKNRLILDKDALAAVFGPKIFVERFMSYLRKADKSLFEKVRASCSTSIGGEAGFREVLRMRDAPEFIQALKPFRDAVETERFVEVMSRNPEKVAIGIDEVLEAWEMGAVEKALISEGYLWNNLEDERVEKLLRAAERGKLNLQVILDGLESSDKVSRFGGVVAVLRYPVPLKKIREAKGD